MDFDPSNRSMKIWESMGTPTPKVWAHLGVWVCIPSHFPTLPGAWDVTLKLPSWPTPLQALALVVNPKLGLQQLWYKSWCNYYYNVDVGTMNRI
jgi:hypothetical protein